MSLRNALKVALFAVTACFTTACRQDLMIYQLKQSERQSYPIVQNPGKLPPGRGDLKTFKRLAETLVLEQESRVILYRDKWSGPRDASVKAWLMHSGKNLLFAAEVTDDELKAAGHPGDWNGDATNLFLRTETEEGVREFIFKFSSAGTRYCYYDRLAYNGETYSWGDLWHEQTSRGYRLIAVIPFRNLGLLYPSMSRISFNLSLEDNDRGAYMILSGLTEGFLNAPDWIPAMFIMD